MGKVETDYRGASLKVEAGADEAALYINGIRRAHSTTLGHQIIRLTSVVQTDYEWHEFIEAVISMNAGGCEVAISASDSVIVSETLTFSEQLS